MKELILLALFGGAGYLVYDAYQAKSVDKKNDGRLPPPANAPAPPNVTVAFNPAWGEIAPPAGLPEDIVMPAGGGFWGALAERFQTGGCADADCGGKHE
jgi:hypothetical protein